MTIMFIADANSIHTVRWVNALSEKGFNIVLVSQNKNRKYNIDNSVIIEYLYINGRKGYYLNSIQLQMLYKKYKPNIISVHYASGYGTLARMAKLPNIILSVWGSDVYEFPYRNKLCRYIIKKNLSYAFYLTSTSKSMAVQLRRICRRKEIKIIPFGIDINRFEDMDYFRNDIFTIGVIKTLEPVYGIDTVIKAYALFIRKIPKSTKTHLLIYGEGTEEKNLQKLCENLKISQQVMFMGYIDNQDVSKAYHKMDMACFGSRRESFGVSIVEAMAAGLPIIATNTDGFTEIIQDKNTGFIVSVNDYVQMANKMRMLFEKPELRRERTLRF